MSYGFENDKTKSAAIETMIQNAVNQAKNDLTTQINGIWNKIYPVGSIFISTNDTNPGQLFGGRWEAYATGRTLVGLDSSDHNFNPLGKTSGIKSASYTPGGLINGTVESHKLTVDEMPKHYHQDPTGAENGFATFRQTDPQHTNVGFQSGGAIPAGYTGRTTEVGGDGGHSHGFSASFTGYNASINVLQPYVVVKIWRRLA